MFVRKKWEKMFLSGSIQYFNMFNMETKFICVKTYIKQILQ